MFPEHSQNAFESTDFDGVEIESIFKNPLQNLNQHQLQEEDNAPHTRRINNHASKRTISVHIVFGTKFRFRTINSICDVIIVLQGLKASTLWTPLLGREREGIASMIWIYLV